MHCPPDETEQDEMRQDTAPGASRLRLGAGGGLCRFRWSRILLHTKEHLTGVRGRELELHENSEQ